MSIDISTAIEDFWAARARGEFFPQAYFDRLTLDDAYRIQLALIDRRVAAGERQIGWKVGLTAKVIQEQFGFHEPLFACILETRPTGHVFGATELIHPGFETELCVRLGRGLEGNVSLEQIRAAIDVIHPSFEIIETRGDLAKQVALGLAARSWSVRLCNSRQPWSSTALRRVFSSTAMKWRPGWARPCSAIP
jgi:2-keto-4-pentenoate hydratase